MIDLPINKEKPLFVDTETNQLYAKIRLVQLYQEEWVEPILVDIRDNSLVELYELIKDAWVVFHNYSYDSVCFVNDLPYGKNYDPFQKWDDTLILSRLRFWEELDSFTLGSCFKKVMGYDPYAEYEIAKSVTGRTFLTTKTRDMAKLDLTEKQLKYAALDVLHLPKLWNVVKECQNEYSYQLDKLFIRRCLSFQWNGVPVDKDEWDRLYEDCVIQIEEATKNLPQGLNVNSFKMVRAVLNSNDSSAGYIMEQAKLGNETAKWIQQKKVYLKILNYLERYNFDRIRGYYGVNSVSGRATCSGSGVKDGSDNLMQIPTKVKSLFRITEENKYFVYADFTQLELRTICAEQGDEVMGKLMREGADLHLYAASKIYHKPESQITPEERLTGKFCNFSLLYMGSVNSFRDVVIRLSSLKPPSIDECYEIINNWKKAYPGIARWHKQIGAKFKAGNLYGQTLNGRKFKSKIFTDLSGVQNQGLGAEVAKLSMHYLFKRCPNFKLLAFIHDSFLGEAESMEQAQEWSKILAESMVCAWFQTIQKGKDNTLPMPIEALVAKKWKGIEQNADYSYTCDGTYETYQKLKGFYGI